MPGTLGHCPCELRTCLEEPAGHRWGCAGGGSATGAPAVLRVTWGEVWAGTVSHVHGGVKKLGPSFSVQTEG